VKIIRVVLIAFLLLPQFCEAQLLTKEWWQGSEVQIGTDLYFYGSRKSSNLAMEPLQYLDRAEDNIGLLEDEVSIIRPFDFTGYGIDESMDFSPSEAISLNVKASFVRPIKSDDNDAWVYIGPSLQYNGNHFGNSYRRLYSSSNDNIYSNVLYFKELGIYDSLGYYNSSNVYDTFVLPRAKMVQLKNSSASIQLGLRSKLYLIRGDKRSLSMDIGFSKLIGLSRKVKVYSEYYEFENTSYYHSINANGEYLSNTYFTLLNDDNRSFETQTYKAPRIHGNSYYAGFNYDRVVRNTNNLMLGFSVKYTQQNIKRKKELLAINRGLSLGLYFSKPIFKIK
jgi:hypothetical protein